MSGQKLYQVSIPWHASVIVKVWASSSEEAVNQALNKAHPSLCCQCSDGIELLEDNGSVSPEVLEIGDSEENGE